MQSQEEEEEEEEDSDHSYSQRSARTARRSTDEDVSIQNGSANSSRDVTRVPVLVVLCNDEAANRTLAASYRAAPLGMITPGKVYTDIPTMPANIKSFVLWSHSTSLVVAPQSADGADACDTEGRALAYRVRGMTSVQMRTWHRAIWKTGLTESVRSLMGLEREQTDRLLTVYVVDMGKLSLQTRREIRPYSELEGGHNRPMSLADEEVEQFVREFAELGD